MNYEGMSLSEIEKQKEYQRENIGIIIRDIIYLIVFFGGAWWVFK